MANLVKSRRWLAGGLTLSILALVLALGYGRHHSRESEKDNLPPMPALGPVLVSRPVTLCSGIHLLGGLSPAAAYVVETSQGLVLVDAGLDREATQLKQEMAALGLDWKRVCAILLTHVHGDHSGGAQYLRTTTGAKIYAGQADAAVLRVGQPREAFFSTIPMSAAITPVATTVDTELNDGQEIVFGEVRFQVLAMPGHTPGSVCYLMKHGDQTVLFSGDVIWSLSTERAFSSPRDRPLGTYTAYLAPRYGGNAAAFLATLRRLRAMPVPDLILPGHPRNDSVPENPHLSPERWQALLDPGIREMEQLLKHFRQDGANFLDDVPKQLMQDLYYLGNFKDVAVYSFVGSGKLFLVNAPGSAELVELLSTRLEQLGLKMAPTAVLLTSSDESVTAGIGALIAKYRLQVVVSAAAVEAIRPLCPVGTSILAADELPAKGWFSVRLIPLPGHGLASIAYQLPLNGKTVLLTGALPIKFSQAALSRLRAEMAQGLIHAAYYRASLIQLGDLKPDLWLPMFPSDGQNANLYDTDWRASLRDNRAMLP